MSGLLRATGLGKRYKSRQVVKDISLEVAPGEIVGLLGPNGAGKTTAFYMIVGLVPCDTGRVTLGDVDLTPLPMHQRARAGLGYLPQEPSVFRRLSVADNLLAILETRPGLDRDARLERLESLLEELHIGHLRDNAGQSLSGGERRRCEVARALAVGSSGPRYLLLDEPFAGVDPLAVADLRDLITGLRRRGMGVLITDHNVRETLSITDRAYILTEGSILASGPSDAIAKDPLVRRHYLGEDFRL